MSGKKIKIFIIVLILIIVLVCAYQLLLSKPQIIVKNVYVESLKLYTESTHPKYIEGHNPVETIEYLVEESKEYEDVQAFVKDDILPSNDPADYTIVTLNLEMTNRTIFDSYCNYIMVNDGKDLYESYLVTQPNVALYEAKRLSTTEECSFSFYIYTKGKSASEIEAFIRNLEFQFPFENDILKNSNQYFRVDDNEDVIFSFNGVQ